jgi:hypothetical protein
LYVLSAWGIIDVTTFQSAVLNRQKYYFSQPLNVGVNSVRQHEMQAEPTAVQDEIAIEKLYKRISHQVLIKSGHK